MKALKSSGAWTTGGTPMKPQSRRSRSARLAVFYAEPSGAVAVHRRMTRGGFPIVLDELNRREHVALGARTIPFQVPVSGHGREPKLPRRNHSKAGDGALAADLVGVEQLD